MRGLFLKMTSAPRFFWARNGISASHPLWGSRIFLNHYILCSIFWVYGGLRDTSKISSDNLSRINFFSLSLNSTSVSGHWQRTALFGEVVFFTDNYSPKCLFFRLTKFWKKIYWIKFIFFAWQNFETLNILAEQNSVSKIHLRRWYRTIFNKTYQLF